MIPEKKAFFPLFSFSFSGGSKKKVPLLAYYIQEAQSSSLLFVRKLVHSFPLRDLFGGTREEEIGLVSVCVWFGGGGGGGGGGDIRFLSPSFPKWVLRLGFSLSLSLSLSLFPHTHSCKQCLAASSTVSLPAEVESRL